MNQVIKSMEYLKDTNSIVATVEITIPLVLKIGDDCQDTQTPNTFTSDSKKGCPLCNSELLDSSPNVILSSIPPKKNVHCVDCGYTGYKTV